MRKFFFFALLTALTSSCSIEDNTSNSSALVEKKQVAQIENIIKGMDYLPLSYLEDGCSDRAYFVALELKEAGIPSSSVLIHGTLQMNKKQVWQYHVATMVAVKSANGSLKKYLFDPIFQYKPLSEKEWLKNIRNYDPQTKLLAAMNGPEFYGEKVLFITANFPGSKSAKLHFHYLTIKAAPEMITPDGIGDQMISSLDDMPKFKIEDMQSAASTLVNYINKEELSESEKKAKIEKLRTRYAILKKHAE